MNNTDTTTAAQDIHDAIRANCDAFYAHAKTYTAFSDANGALHAAAEALGLADDLGDLMLAALQAAR